MYELKSFLTTLDTNHSVTVRMQTTNRSFNPAASVFYSQASHTTRHEQIRFVRPNDQLVDQYEFICQMFRSDAIKDKLWYLILYFTYICEAWLPQTFFGILRFP